MLSMVALSSGSSAAVNSAYRVVESLLCPSLGRDGLHRDAGTCQHDAAPVVQLSWHRLL